MPKQPTNPQDDPMINEEAPTVGFKKNEGPNKEEEWKKVDAIFNAARSSFLEKDSTFDDVLDSLIATLMDMKAAGKPTMGGLGTENPEMDIPALPQDEELPENL